MMTYSSKSSSMATSSSSPSPVPWEVLESVSNYLDPKTLGVASCVSKEWFSTMSTDHRWAPLCSETFPSVVSSLRSCFPTSSYRKLYGIGHTASKRRSENETPFPRPRISLADLVFAVEVRTGDGAVFGLTETADKFAGSVAFMFDVELDGGKLVLEEAAAAKVTWNVVLGPGMRAAFTMMESEGRKAAPSNNGWWFSSELPAAGCGGDVRLVADVTVGMGGAKKKVIRLGMMNQASLRYVGVDHALRYLQHFLLPYSGTGCNCA